MLREALQSLNPENYLRHERESEIWKAEAGRATDFIRRSTWDYQEGRDTSWTQIADNLQVELNESAFLSNSNRFLFRQVLYKGEPGLTYIMPTLARREYQRITQYRKVKRPRISESTASFLPYPERRVGVIVLRPTDSYKFLDRQAVIVHELRHAQLNRLPIMNDGWQKEHRDKVTKSSIAVFGEFGPLKSWSRRKRKAVEEVEAYKVTGIVLDQGGQGETGPVESELSGCFTSSLNETLDVVRNDMSRLENFPLQLPKTPAVERLLEETDMLRSTLLVLTLNVLYSEGQISEDKMMDIMELHGVI